MAYKGQIGVGTISVAFASDYSNLDTDLLMASYADRQGGNAIADGTEIAPGGTGTVQVAAPQPGFLEVKLDTGHQSESGRLSVTDANGVRKNDEPTQGPVRWTFTVV